MRTWPFLLALGLTAITLPALGDDRLDEARRAYDAGARAYDAHDFAQAVRLLLQADELAPNATALELAMASAVRLEDPVVAIRLDRKTRGRTATPRLSELRQNLRAKFEKKIGFVSVRCPEGKACTVERDGERAPENEELVVPTGIVDVTVRVEARPVPHRIEVGSGQTIVIDLRSVIPISAPGESAPAHANVLPPPRAIEKEGRGVSPALFWTGLILTGALAGVSTISTIETSNRYSDFKAAPSAAGRESGQNSQLRTNILWLATGIVGLGTAATGLFIVRWNAGTSKKDAAWSIGVEGRF